MDKGIIEFSVLITTYIGEVAENLDASLKSILVEQTCIPTQVVLVLDGPIKEECERVIESYQKRFPHILEVVSTKTNQGQSKASALGLKYIKYEFIARMDSDDISDSLRFEKEIQAFIDHPECDVVGGWIEEFSEVPGDTCRMRVVPENDVDIKNTFCKRTPINNVTAMIRKKALLKAGGYGRNTVNEDYSLYAHMWVAGSSFYNIQDVLVYVRIGNGMISRRKDWRIFSDWCKDQLYLYRNNKHTLITSLLSCIKCFGFMVMPEKIKQFVYSHYLRREKNDEERV